MASLWCAIASLAGVLVVLNVLETVPGAQGAALSARKIGPPNDYHVHCHWKDEILSPAECRAKCFVAAGKHQGEGGCKHGRCVCHDGAGPERH